MDVQVEMYIMYATNFFVVGPQNPVVCPQQEMLCKNIRAEETIRQQSGGKRWKGTVRYLVLMDMGGL